MASLSGVDSISESQRSGSIGFLLLSEQCSELDNHESRKRNIYHESRKRDFSHEIHKIREKQEILTTKVGEEIFTLPETDSDALINLHIFIDRGVIETYLNQRECYSIQIYPDFEGPTTIAVIQKGGSPKIMALDAWNLDSIW